jgi:ribonucleoside-diphosphate reductase alpha chain
VVKSGGKTRRAAKMNTLKDWHPDIEEFIVAKMNEEKKAWALIEQGYDGSFNGEAYGSVMFQNENLSVRASDAFMEAAAGGGEWWTKAVRDGRPVEKKEAKALLRNIAEGTWTCGDPGMQFDDTIHTWHTCKGTDRQHSTNPCSEYLFLNDTACNLASLNLLRFKKPDGSFDVQKFRRAVRLFITAQEVLVDNASYPTEAIATNSHIFRTLGLGYANLGSLIMSYGHGYDSDQGRCLAGAITAVMTGTAYAVSSEIAEQVGAFPGYHDASCFHVKKPLQSSNVDSMLEVIALHRKHVHEIDPSCPDDLRLAARESWDEALENGKKHGYRNAQVTVLAPTGTIGFLMDCDTTGIEPDIALVKYKLLAGGGMLKIVNQTVPEA